MIGQLTIFDYCFEYVLEVASSGHDILQTDSEC